MVQVHNCAALGGLHVVDLGRVGGSFSMDSCPPISTTHWLSLADIHCLYVKGSCEITVINRPKTKEPPVLINSNNVVSWWCAAACFLGLVKRPCMKT